MPDDQGISVRLPARPEIFLTSRASILPAEARRFLVELPWGKSVVVVKLTTTLSLEVQNVGIYIHLTHVYNIYIHLTHVYNAVLL